MHRRDLFSLPAFALGFAVPANPPAAATRTFNVVDFGAVANGKTMNTRALQATVDAAFHSGGGVVYIPPGVYLTAGIVLKNRITLYLETGATLLGSPEFNDYDVQPGPSLEGDANARHLIFARDAESVRICGGGVVDGQGKSFWKPAGRPPTAAEDMWQDVVQFDWKATPRRPSPMLEFVSCRNLRIENITIQNAPSWTLRPVDCDTVVLDGVRIRNPIFGPNTDGLDITASRNVFVSNCDISCGDDAICIKSENPYGPTHDTANITITNCVLTTCCNGFKIGTSTHGAMHDIVFTNSVIHSKDDPINERVIAGLAIEMVDGGTLEGVLVSNISMRNVRTPIFVRLGTRKESAETHLRDVSISGIRAVGALVTSSISGVPGFPVENVSISDLRIASAERGVEAWADNAVPELEKQYPESRMFGRLPAFGIYVRHARGLRLRDVEVIAVGGDARPALVCDDVDDLVIAGFDANAPSNSRATMVLRDVRHAFVHGCRAPLGSKCLLAAEGARCEAITVAGNAISDATQLVRSSADISVHAVTVR